MQAPHSAETEAEARKVVAVSFTDPERLAAAHRVIARNEAYRSARTLVLVSNDPTEIEFARG